MPEEGLGLVGTISPESGRGNGCSCVCLCACVCVCVVCDRLLYSAVLCYNLLCMGCAECSGVKSCDQTFTSVGP